nr:DinB superfamily [uncultured bacterium]
MPDRKQTILDILNQGRAKLTHVINQLQPTDWDKSVQEGDQKWTVKQIITHLVDAQKGMTGQITTISSGQEAIPADFDLDRWNKRAVEKGADKTSEDLLTALDEGRTKLLDLVKTFSDTQLDQKGRHSSLAIMSVEEIVTLIGTHEAEHASLIAQALSLEA